MLHSKKVFQHKIFSSILASSSIFTTVSIARAGIISESKPDDIVLWMDFNSNEASAFCDVGSGIGFGVQPVQYWPVLKVRALVYKTNSSFFPENNLVDFETLPYIGRWYETSDEAKVACDKIMKRFHLSRQWFFGFFKIDLRQFDWSQHIWVGGIEDRTPEDQRGESLPLPRFMKASLVIND
jgi:hypothetical protein